jgi:peptidoglycan/xylan/chitin deacetylase (PgdA/CDA1 family)
MNEDMRRGAEAIAAVCGQSPTLYRPPFGAVSAADLCKLLWSDLTLVLWNKDPKDFACQRGQAASDGRAPPPLDGGDIVLLHDVHPHSLAMLPDLVAQAHRAGLEFGTISEWTRPRPRPC